MTNALMAQFGHSNSGSSWHMDDCVDGDGVSRTEKSMSGASLDSIHSVSVYDTLCGALQMMLSNKEQGV